MKVNGSVRISLTLDVYDLETDAVYEDQYGKIRVSDGDQFFLDWIDGWERGTGELLGTSVQSDDLELEEEDAED